MQDGSIYYALMGGRYILKFVGDVRLTLCSSLDQHLKSVLDRSYVQDILVDLTETTGIDSTTLGLIAKLSIYAEQCHLPHPTIVSTNRDITRVLMSMGFDHIFVLLDSLPQDSADLEALPLVKESAEEIRLRIVEAHRILMNLNDSNREAFKDLMITLEDA
ncbi:STAS domain-containing protein [Pontibacter sp. JAM-7]|uniref:STAS domain-containing protein n=1 Tax=Pontibacter sp. JAM-7 TaxID=3366581 RepID=UPI003AF936FB